jgi:hypothetical protein
MRRTAVQSVCGGDAEALGLENLLVRPGLDLMLGFLGKLVLSEGAKGLATRKELEQR